MAFDCCSTLYHLIYKITNIIPTNSLYIRMLWFFPFNISWIGLSQYFHFISFNFYFYCSELHMSFALFNPRTHACSMEKCKVLEKLTMEQNGGNKTLENTYWRRPRFCTCVFWIPETCTSTVYIPVNWSLFFLSFFFDKRNPFKSVVFIKNTFLQMNESI